MKTIPLTQGFVAIVDDETFEELAKYKWCYSKVGYASRRASGKFVYMHREITQAQKGEFVDHINLNKLDNRRINLRICSKADNQRNQRARGGSSKYKGVSFRSDTNRYSAQIWVNSKKINLGCFRSEDEAAMAYNAAAIKYHGEFAFLNNVKPANQMKISHAANG